MPRTLEVLDLRGLGGFFLIEDNKKQIKRSKPGTLTMMKMKMVILMEAADVVVVRLVI